MNNGGNGRLIRFLNRFQANQFAAHLEVMMAGKAEEIFGLICH